MMGFPGSWAPESLARWAGCTYECYRCVDRRRSPAPAIVSVHRGFPERTCFSLCFNRRLLPSASQSRLTCGAGGHMIAGAGIRVDEEGTKVTEVKNREARKL